MPRAIVVIPAAYQSACNAATTQYFDQQGNGDTFNVPLVPVGSSQGAMSTHFWCCANFSQVNWELLPTVAASFPLAVIREVDLVASPTAPEGLLTELGLQRPVTSLA